MTLSILIPVRNDSRVRDVVAALRPQLRAGEEIVVADDGTDLLPSLPGARVIPVHRGNPGAARNAAVRAAAGDILLFTDADTVIPPDWVSLGRSALEDPAVAAIQGMSHAAGSGPLARHMQTEYERFVRSHASSGLRDICDTRCFGIRREIFERFWFGTDGPYSEDAVLGRRLYESGIPIVFLREWTVGHLYSNSPRRELARIRRYAVASRRHERLKGFDLFRSPEDPPPRGPGAALLRLTRGRPVLAAAAGRTLAVAAGAFGAGAKLPGALGGNLFDAARRATVLSVRLGPGSPGRPPHEDREMCSPAGQPAAASPPGPLVTVVVVPRERFGVAPRALETLLRNTSSEFRLVYVDGASPPSIAGRIADAAAERGFDLVRTERLLSPNEARNLGFARVAGRYAVFVDNDLLVEPGWLDALVRCAEETGADLVGPLYGVGEPENGIIHMAGGTARIEEREDGRHLRETHRFSGKRTADVAAFLSREATELIEFHCMLVRTETMRKTGPLDEHLLSTGEHIDLCLRVREAGGSVYFEPASRVSYLPPPPLDAFDRRYFRLRWSEAWTRQSLARLRDQWRLSDKDPYLVDHLRWLRSHRRLALRPVERALEATLPKPLARTARMAIAAAEIVWNRWRVPSVRKRSAG